MANEIVLPELGEGIDQAKVLAVLVSPGDKVRKDQTIIEVETEKATAEVPSDFEGTVSAVHVKEGQDISVGQAILSLEAGDSTAAAPAPKAEPVEVVEMSPAAEVVDAPPPPPPAPAPRPEPAASATATATAPPKVVPIEESYVPAPPSPGKSVAASPSVRRLARELGVDIAEVPGTSEGGRVSNEDVKSYARHLISRRGAPREVQAPVASPTARTQPQLPDFTQWGDVEREPMSAIRRATADHMVNAWSTAPQVTQFDSADITELEVFRKRYGNRVQATGGKLTVTAMAVKIVAGALKKFPQFNSSLDAEAQELVLKQYVHVGVAVDTENGLMVPVIRDADKKNIVEIAEDLQDLAEKARARKISLDALRGGTFSVSNLGGLGTTYFSPIVNWPEVAILGMGRASVQAVHQNGEFVPRKILPMALTYDHRVIDGADAARFLRWIAEALENPMLLALEG